MAAAKLDTSLVEKKFSSARATPDSIQSVSLWTLTHKSQCDQIVATWLSVLKTSKIEKRLTLFYICNEIVQTCRKRHAIIYKDAFKEVLRDAAILARDKSICDNVKRIFKIWEERGTYEKDFVQELMNLLTGVKVEPSSSKLLSEFNPTVLRESLREFVSLENDLNDKKKTLTSVNVELNNKQIAKLFKDRNQGIQYSQQIEGSRVALREFIDSMEKMIVERVSVIDKLECGLLFYESQYGDARMVTNAYRNFGNRIKILQKKLEEQRRILPDPASPVPSPPTDAPSPVDSLNGDCNRDNMEPVDMDLSDEEMAGGNVTLDASAISTPNHFSAASHTPLNPPVGFSSMFDTPRNTHCNTFPFGNLNNASHPSSGSTPFSPTFQNQRFGSPTFFNNFQSLSTTPQLAKEAFSMRSHDSKSPYSLKSRSTNAENGKPFNPGSVAPLGHFEGFMDNDFYCGNSQKSMQSEVSIIPVSNICNNNSNSQLKVPCQEEEDNLKQRGHCSQENGSHSIQSNQDSEKPVDPFSILDKLLAQSRKGGNTPDGGKPSLLDLLSQTAKHPEVPSNSDKHVTSIETATSIAVQDLTQKNFIDSDIDKVKETNNWPSLLTSKSGSSDPIGFSADNSCQNNPGILPKIEKNILSKVSDLKPDVFEVLKSIISKTKQPVTSSQSELLENQNISMQSSESPTLQENESDYYGGNESDFSQSKHMDEPHAEHQHNFFPEEQYDKPPFEEEGENDAQENNFPPPAVVPKGPLVAPKCFLDLYSHSATENVRGPNGNDEYFDAPMPETTHAPVIQIFPECEQEEYNNYYPPDEPNIQNYNAEVCNDFAEHPMHNGPRFNDEYLPPQPNYNYQPDFHRNHFNRNIRFQPRPAGFHNFPRQRFGPPRFPGRGFFHR